MRYRHGEVISEIDNLPGCSQIGVFHSVFIPPNKRGLGLGQTGHAERLVEAEHLGYDACICTVNLENKAQIKILESFKWKLVFQFESTKTTNLVGLFVKEIT